MGFFRVYLALCVISAHTGQLLLPWGMHSGADAVQIFFIFSGFYMAMVLSSARYTSVHDFYLSRFLRVFLPYWLVLLSVVVWSLLVGCLTHHWLALSAYKDDPLSHNGIAGLFFAFLSNLTLYGQDWIMFLSQHPGKPLTFTSNFWADPSPLWHYLVIPQCWSIGLEITFYALVPYLNRLKSRWLLLIASMAIFARFFVYWQMGAARDPWSYRFFPFEIAFFIFGMFGYRLYVKSQTFYPRILTVNSNYAYLVGTIILLLVIYVQLKLSHRLVNLFGLGAGHFISNSFLALALPFLFFIFRNQPSDRFIGELSYPIYLVHFCVITTLSPILGHRGLHHQNLLTISTALISISIALLMCLYFITPLDRWRHVLAHKKNSYGQ